MLKTQLMKLTVKHTIFLFLVVTGVSCKKFLQEQPSSFLQPGDNLSSSKVARALANGCYTNLNGVVTGQPSSYGGNTWNLMEFMTGKSNSDLGQTGFVSFQTLTYTTTSFYFDTWWQQMYLGIGDCNLAIEEIPGITASGLTDTAKMNMLAEV